MGAFERSPFGPLAVSQCLCELGRTAVYHERRTITRDEAERIRKTTAPVRASKPALPFSGEYSIGQQTPGVLPHCTRGVASGMCPRLPRDFPLGCHPPKTQARATTCRGPNGPAFLTALTEWHHRLADECTCAFYVATGGMHLPFPSTRRSPCIHSGAREGATGD